MKILLIDDSRATRSIIRRILNFLDADIIEAENGKIALELLEKETLPDIAFVDWNMPVMNGLEFVTQARQNEAYSSMLIMMVTTETEMHQVVKALEAGANEYLMKPFTGDMIKEKLGILGLYAEEES